jgi:hypothetical protein
MGIGVVSPPALRVVGSKDEGNRAAISVLGVVQPLPAVFACRDGDLVPRVRRALYHLSLAAVNQWKLVLVDVRERTGDVREMRVITIIPFSQLV